MSTPDRDLEPAEALRAEREAELEAELGAEMDVEGDPIAETEAAPATPELSIGFSPRQVLGGFSLLAALFAALVVWLFRRRKR